MKQFYVNFYDMIDGWGDFGFFNERSFDDLEPAIFLCNSLQSSLNTNNKKCGEHYGVFDTTKKVEVYCSQNL